MKTRKPHKWKPNKRNMRPRNLLFVDVETYESGPVDKFKEHSLRLGVACYQQRRGKNYLDKPQWLYFDNVNTFWDFVEAHCYKNGKLYIVGHGLGYDIGILRLFETAQERHWEETFSYIADLNCLVNYKTDKGSLCFISTTNFFKTKLENLGDLVGLEKLKVDFANVDDDTLSEYCKRDVDILMKVLYLWLDFLDEHDLGDFKGTIASQAFAAFRHRFLHHDVWVHGNMEVCKLERESYRGGRCEVFTQGKFPTADYYKLDVNGVYGYVMEKGTFPCDFKAYLTTVDVPLLRKVIRNYAVVARVVVETDIPFFPIKLNGVNTYPVGCFETVLTTPELEFALDNCRILEVKGIALYESYPLFKDYATYFSLLKGKYTQEGNKIFRHISKLFLNTLYGKLAQRDYKALNKQKESVLSRLRKSKISSKGLLQLSSRVIKVLWDKWGELVWGNEPPRSVPTNSKLVRNEKWTFKELLGKKPKMRKITYFGHKDVDTGFFNAAVAFADDYLTWEGLEESYNSFPAISAHVTAYARLYLWELMVRAGRENVYYCDTDGFICNRQGYENCLDRLDPYKAGFLKIEEEGTDLTIIRRKGYIFNGKRTIGGIRDNAVEVSPLVFEQDQFLGMAGAIRQGNPDKRGVSKVERRVKSEIKGGILHSDGTVEPFRVNLVEGELVIENLKSGE